MMDQPAHQSASRSSSQSSLDEPLSPGRSSRPSGIFLRLPDYERYTRVFPIHLRDFTKYDSLVNDGEREIEIAPLLAWGLLLVNMLSTAMVPCWLMSNLKYEGLTQNSWRFLTVALLTLPFVGYERRQVEAVGGSLFALVDSEMIKRSFMSSISVCIWFLIVKYAVKLTSMIHTFNLMCLQTFVAVLLKRIRGGQHH
jgi:hypothetical protein